MPNKTEVHKRAKPVYEQNKKDGKIGSYTQSDNFDAVLRIVAEKIGKLNQGDFDPPQKAKLIEIATNNLAAYFRGGGTSDRLVMVPQGTGKENRITAGELQKMLKQYQGR